MIRKPIFLHADAFPRNTGSAAVGEAYRPPAAPPRSAVSWISQTGSRYDCNRAAALDGRKESFAVVKARVGDLVKRYGRIVELCLR